jgi:hypothetical protein
MRKSRSGRRQTRGTSLLPETWPDPPLRIRRLLRFRIGLPCEPGRGLCQDLALGLQLLILTAQLHQLFALGAAKYVFPRALVRVGPREPVADRLLRGFKLIGELAQDCGRLAPDLRCSGGTQAGTAPLLSAFLDSLPSQRLRCHESGSTPAPRARAGPDVAC